MADEQTCPRCGMAQGTGKGGGGRGVDKGGTIYCCDGCAENTGCTCASG